MGMYQGLPETASVAYPNFQTSVAAVFVLASAAIARSLAEPFPDCSFKAAIQLQKGTALASIARGLGGLPELSTALGLNITWGLSLLLIVIAWAIAIKKRMIALGPLDSDLALGIPDAVPDFDFLRNRCARGSADFGAVLVFCGKAACLCSSVPLTVLAMGWVWSQPWHYGMALTAFLVSVWGAWPTRRSPEFESPTRLLTVSLAVLLILQLPLTAETVRAEVQGPIPAEEPRPSFFVLTWAAGLSTA